jgi:hypothetical protein
MMKPHPLEMVSDYFLLLDKINNVIAITYGASTSTSRHYPPILRNESRWDPSAERGKASLRLLQPLDWNLVANHPELGGLCCTDSQP